MAKPATSMLLLHRKRYAEQRELGLPALGFQRLQGSAESRGELVRAGNAIQAVIGLEGLVLLLQQQCWAAPSRYARFQSSNVPISMMNTWMYRDAGIKQVACQVGAARCV